MRICIGLTSLSLALAALAVVVPGAAQLDAQEDVPPKSLGWTLDDALKQLHYYPRDPYLQYVALQLARPASRVDDVANKIVSGVGDDLPGRDARDRASRVDLFSLFSGAHAVQESLQLDTMRGQRPAPRRPFDKDRPGKSPPLPKAVEVARLTGPTIKSHPWKEMLAGKKPEVGQLARYVPVDNYFVEFRSLVKLLDLMNESDLWGTHLFNQAVQEARTQLVGERLKKQLAVESSGLLRPLYDTIIEEVAVTGSDLYLREGSDVTLLFRAKQPAVLKARMNGFLTNARKANADAKRREGKYLGIDYVHLATPDRSVHVYSAYPTADLHVRSNSKVGFERVLDSIVGRNADGKTIPRLGDTDEFAYIRTLLPRGAKEEDGFVYLSDPFIRRLVGPEVKLTERRRMLAYNHLRMIGHAALMYRTQHGKPATSLEELAKGGCVPGEFNKGDLVCPEGGMYVLSADGMTGFHSIYGRADALTPCCEVPVKRVSGEEAEEYKRFLEEYNRYWQTFFDPIALRIQATDNRYRMETVVLPLLDNSLYTGLARALGGKPEPLDMLPVPKRTIFSAAFRLDKRELLESIGMSELLTEVKEESKRDPKKPSEDTRQMVDRFRMLGIALHNYHDAMRHFPTNVSFDKKGKKTGLSWRVHLLPYLEQDNLYREFRLDEPWDSEHNKKLIARMPEIYRPSNPKLAAAHKTRICAPLGDKLIFPTSNRKVRFADILDGTSNTLMLVEADDKHAVVWTKPDDLVIDLEKPLNGLAIRSEGGFLALMGDGSIKFLRKSLDTTKLAALFTRAGGEVVNIEPGDELPVRFSRNPQHLPDYLAALDAGKFLARGIGNQVALHVYDSEPMFDLSMANFLGMSLGSFNGRAFMGNMEMLTIVPVVASLNSPVYVSVPVKDPKVVDACLVRLDEYLAGLAREQLRFGGPFRMSQDFYHFPGDQGKNFRAYSFRFGPLKWRLFWGRIGNGLYVASKPYILEDLAALNQKKEAVEPANRGPVAHAMVRLRPENWDRVLANYRLGWAENNREACLHNLGPLSSLSRALAASKSGTTPDALNRSSGRLYGVHFFCPEEGQFVVSPDGKEVTCSVHGSARSPKQATAPLEKSGLSRLLREFADMTMELTFLEDGLHAVVTIDRKERKE